jgi:hypothetical protein
MKNTLAENMRRFGTKNLVEQQSRVDTSKITTPSAEALVGLVSDKAVTFAKLQVTQPGQKVPIDLIQPIVLRVAENSWILFNKDGVRPVYLDPNDPNVVTARTTYPMPTNPVSLWALITQLASPYLLSDEKLRTLAELIQQRNWINLKNIDVKTLEQQLIALTQKRSDLIRPFQDTFRGYVFALANGAGNQIIAQDIKTKKAQDGSGLRFK